MKYKEYRLGELTDYIKGFAFKSRNFKNIGIPIIKVGNLNSGLKKSGEWFYLDEKEKNSYLKYAVRENDAIISTVGSWPSNPASVVGKCCIVPKRNENNFLNQNAVIVRTKSNILEQKYLNYILKSDKFKNYITGCAQGSASQASITLEDIKKYKIYLPDVSIQKYVSKILYNIDQKIEINNQINDNLFKFAINYVISKQEKNQVPISQFAIIQGGYAFKTKDFTDTPTKNRIIKIKNLSSEINADVINSQFAEDEVVNNLNQKFKLEKGDVTIAMTGAELGKTGFIYGFDKCYLNQRVCVIRGRSKERELYLKILALSYEFQTLLNSKGYGSAQPNISTNDIESILINDITKDNLKDIYERLNSIYLQMIANSEENLNLEQVRDILLPKLMNGEIDLDNIKV